MNGKFIVFEGPDNVGKSTVCDKINEHLRAAGFRSTVASFPGREVGTLGNLVYSLHHDLQLDEGEKRLFDIRDIHPASLQTLHIAAHIDAIERTILPKLRTYDFLILDRYWWSTWAYGLLDTISMDTLDKMIDLELSFWDGVTPEAVILLNRTSPENPDDKGRDRLVKNYNILAKREALSYPVHFYANDRTIEEAVHGIIELIGLPY